MVVLTTSPRAVWTLGLLMAACLWQPSVAKTRSQGEVTIAARAFSDDGDSRTLDQGLSTDFKLDIKAKQDGGFRQQLRLSGRVAVWDRDRSVLIVNDAWVGWRNRWVQLSIGAETINWSTAEAFHPTDSLNSRNLDSDLENPEKMGELMAKMRLRFLEGGLTAHYLPVRIAPRLPGRRSRLNFTQGQSIGGGQWVNRNGEISSGRFAHQFAIRLDQTVGQTDLTAHYVSHNERSVPSLLLNPTNGNVAPLYPFVERMGGSLVSQLGDWLVKAEGEYRRYGSVSLGPTQALAVPLTADHVAVAAGFDYGWSYESGGEGTVLVEGQVLHADGVSTKDLGFVGPFQRDVLLGYRHAHNDEDGTEQLVGVIADVERPGELMLTVTHQQRIDNVWKYETKFQYVRAPDAESLLYQQDGNAAAYLDVIRSF